MTRWIGNLLDLGALGSLVVSTSQDYTPRRWWWGIRHGSVVNWTQVPPYKSAADARRAAIAWLRRALKQAAKRLNNDTMKGRTK